IDNVLTSPHCLARETALTAFGRADSQEYLASLEELPEEQTDSYAMQLQKQIGNYRGKGNLIIFTHESNIRDLSFQQLREGYFLVLKPMGKSEYEEFGIYKLNN
ncbi:MAG: hypothetical protein ABW158_07275, partial [Candidatus Thiodiazotropha sp. 6PDIVS]